MSFAHNYLMRMFLKSPPKKRNRFTGFSSVSKDLIYEREAYGELLMELSNIPVHELPDFYSSITSYYGPYLGIMVGSLGLMDGSSGNPVYDSAKKTVIEALDYITDPLELSEVLASLSGAGARYNVAKVIPEYLVDVEMYEFIYSHFEPVPHKLGILAPLLLYSKDSKSLLRSVLLNTDEHDAVRAEASALLKLI